jgi:MFS family permease
MAGPELAAPEPAVPESPPPLVDGYPTPAQAKGMRMFWWDGLFAGVPMALLLQYLPLFAVAYGANNAEVGLMAAGAGLGAAVALLPGAWLSDLWPRRKTFVVLTSGLLARAPFVAFILLPFITDGEAALRLIIFLVMIQAFLTSLGTPAWTSLAADIVPLSIRGRYFAWREFVYGAAGMFAAPAAGLIVAVWAKPEGWQGVWLLALTAGALSAWFFSRIPEEPRPRPSEGTPAPPPWHATILRDANFLIFGGTVFLWNISLYAASPFFNVYLVKNLGASEAWVGGLAAVASAFGLVGQTMFGRLLDARGSRWLMAVCGLFIPLLPWAWYLVDAPWQVIFINAVAGVAWAGYTLGSFNFLLIVSPPAQRRYYAAAYQTLVFLSTAAGPLIGGLVAQSHSIKALFIVSGAGRLAAHVLFLRFVHEGRPDTRSTTTAATAPMPPA